MRRMATWMMAMMMAYGLSGCNWVFDPYSVKGTVSGLKGTVVLQNVGDYNLTVKEDGNFTFLQQWVSGTDYNVTVVVQPEGQACTVDHGSGVIVDTDITDVKVVCTEKDTPATNQPPVTHAGADQSVVEGAVVTLYSSSSSDPDGTITAYAWTEGGTTLGTASTLSHTFPVGTHTITLTVTDDDGATATDTVVVTVTAAPPPANTAPVANAQSTTTNEDTAVAITLTGNDADGDTLNYTVVSNPSHGTLSGTAPDVTYTPNANYHGSDSFTFKVNDGTVDSAAATVSITIASVNDAPTADAGDDQSVDKGDTVTLDGSGSLDPDGSIVSYEWKEGTTVLGTTVTMSKSDFAVGSHLVTLTVTDDNGSTATDDVNITVKNGCWVTLSDPVLDINQSLGAELPSSAMDPSDTLYTAWTEGEWGNANYYVKSFDPVNNSWQTLGGKLNTRKATSWPSARIKLDPNDNYPYVYFYEENSTSRGHIVKKWNGSDWDQIYTDTSRTKNYNMDINQSSGYPTIVYQSNENVFSFKSYDGSTWDQAFNNLDQHQRVYAGRLLINGAKPYMIYTYTANYSHSAVRDYNGTDWVYLGALESNTSERQATCAAPIIDKNGNLIVAYVEKGTPTHGSIAPNVYVKRYDGTAWSVIGDKINGSTTVSVYWSLGGGSGDNPCVALAEDSTTGYLYVAWSHKANNKTTIYTSKYDGSSWSEAAKPIEEDHSISGPSMVIDSNGRMNVSVMYDSTPGRTDTDDIKVYRCEQENGGS